MPYYYHYLLPNGLGKLRYLFNLIKPTKQTSEYQGSVFV